MYEIQACNCCCVEVKILLSASDLFKAIKLGGTPVDEDEMRNLWEAQQEDEDLRAELTAAAAYSFHTLLGEIPFENVFANPSPFVLDRTQWGSW